LKLVGGIQVERDIKAIIFDWAGTTVDYGCFAPIHAFKEAFQREQIELSNDEVRKPMGLSKRDHVMALLTIPRVQEQWTSQFNRNYTEEDIDRIYQTFEKVLFEQLHAFTEPLPGVVEIMAYLRSKEIKVGSTTGYTREMMDIVEKHAKINGYEPDSIVCSDEVAIGRPAPNMIFQNMMNLHVFPPQLVVKVGDTVTDIKEGKNAGVWTVGIVLGSNELGLTEEEVSQMSSERLNEQIENVRQRYIHAGADYVIQSIHELPNIINDIENFLREGQEV
jgi:phosphonoacetaldehyde hydrolase